MTRDENLLAVERLIVAADFSSEDGRAGIFRKVLEFADSLAGTGVIIKVNSALRAHGYDLIDELHGRDLKVFADLKLNDIPATMAADGELLREANPYIVTAMCSAGVQGLKALKAELPNSEVLGVTALTSLTDDDTNAMFSCSTVEAVMRFASQAASAGVNGLINSPAELSELVKYFGLLFSLNTPGIRPAWSAVAGDDQNAKRVMTPGDAIRAGAHRIVIGRPITQAKSPRDAVLRTIEEIEQALC